MHTDTPHPLIETLRTLVHSVTSNPHATLYRRLYAQATTDIRSIEDWRRLPPLEKECVVATPFWERTYSAAAQIDYIRASSGTSGKNLLVVPKTRPNGNSTVARFAEQTGVLTFLYPQHQYETDYGGTRRIPILAGDPADLEGSVRLADELHVSCIQVYPFLLDQLMPLLERRGMTDRISTIILTGERVQASDVARYHEHCPNAQLILWYASIESQGLPAVALPTRKTTDILYTPHEDYYWELLDDDDNVVATPDGEGEVVYTTLWSTHNDLPLLRYRSGDIARRVTHADGRHEYVILGRKHIDRIKITEGELRVEAVEDAILNVFGSAQEFELHFEKRATSGQKPQITLRIKGAPKHSVSGDLGHALARTLAIAPGVMYADIIAKGAHAPLVCEMVDSFPYTAKKKRKFHVHEDALPR